MSGAAVLSAMGCVNAGAGLVRLAVVKSIQPIVARRAPLETTMSALPETSDGFMSSVAPAALMKIIQKFQPDVIALGPGLGASDVLRKWLLALLFHTTFPLVVDADGLNVLRLSDFNKKRKAPWIMTPHVGELARLLKSSTQAINGAREKFVKKAAQQIGAVCLLKGSGTLIAQSASVWKNPTGNASMASAGMGDVLTGMIAGLWAQYPLQNMETAVQAACVGAFVHGRAGDVAHKKEGGLSLKASTLAETIAHTFKFIR